MQRWTSFTLRAVFILGFLVVMPVMALPQVAGLLDRLLYGHSENTVPPLKVEEEHGALSTTRHTATAQEAARAGHEMPLDGEGSDQFASPGHATLASLAHVNPPPLKPAPDFLPQKQVVRDVQPSAEVGPLDQATAARIDAVRRRLEE